MLASNMLKSSSKRFDSRRLYGFCRAAVCAVMLVMAIASCRDHSEEARSLLADRSRRGFIVFVGAGPGDALWPTLKAGALRYDRDSPIEIRCLNPATDFPKSQVELLSGLDITDLRGICIHMNEDIDSVGNMLSRLRNNGIAIVSMLDNAGAGLRLNHVGVDDMEVGEALAQCTIEALGDKGGTIMVLHAGNDHPIYGLRRLTFMERMRKASRVVVMGEFDCKADPDKARQIIMERTQRYPRLDLWVAMDDWPLSDGVPARQVFTTSHQRYITFGGLPRQWPLIREGLCPYIVAAEYGEVASRAATLCYSGIRSPEQEQRTYRVSLRTITPGNLDMYCRDWASWAEVPATAASPPGRSY